ncbi:MAG TPA: DUF6358 family protein [Mucilaginibacter sp.]|nr:DUF6358 family protein [Mucilaginibacter sp.]
MGKKLALNVLYNIGIFVCLILAYTFGYEHPRYEYLACAVFIGTILVILKIRLMKDVRNMQKKP